MYFAKRADAEMRQAQQNAPWYEGKTLDTADGSDRELLAYAIQAGATRENPESGLDGVGVQESTAYTLEARAEV